MASLDTFATAKLGFDDLTDASKITIIIINKNITYSFLLQVYQIL